MADPELGRVVIVDPAFLGDVVFDAPLVAAIKGRAPSSFVGLVVRPPAEAVARAIIGVDRVHVFDKRGRARGLKGVRRMGRELAAERYDTALIPHPSLRSAMVAVAARIPRRIGNARGAFARWLLTEHKPEAPGDTFVGARLRLLGVEAGTMALEGTMSALRPRPAVEADGRRRIGLVLGSQWPTKRWSAEQAARFVAGIDRSQEVLVLIGSAEERRLYDAVPDVFEGAVDRLGGTVDEMIAAIASCDVLIAGDTGPLHVARALGVRVIALFGPTPEARHSFALRDRLLSVELPCRPCSAHGDLTCPEGHHRCMKELDAARVLASMRAVLGTEPAT